MLVLSCNGSNIGVQVCSRSVNKMPRFDDFPKTDCCFICIIHFRLVESSVLVNFTFAFVSKKILY